jgi:hypothetical protein
MGFWIGLVCGLPAAGALLYDLSHFSIGDGWPDYKVTVSAPNQTPIRRAWSFTGSPKNKAVAIPFRPEFLTDGYDWAKILDPVTIEIRSKCSDRRSGLGITRNSRWYAQWAVIVIECESGELWAWEDVELSDPAVSKSVTCRPEHARRVK